MYIAHIFLFAILLLGTACRAPLTVDGLPSVPRREYLKPAFDDRTWVLANRRANPHQSLTEYLPQGQSPLNWTESYGGTFHGEGHHTGSLETQYRKFISDIGKTCNKLESRLFSSGDVDLYYEWKIHDCDEHPDQVELGRFLRSTEGIYRLAYVRKVEALSDTEREKWLSLLHKAQLRRAK